MKTKDYFGDYKNNNINTVIEYMKTLDNELEKYYNFGKPFFKGDYKLKYKTFLDEKTLNNNPLEVNKVLNYISNYFENIPNWNNPGTMINVIPPVNLVSMAAINLASMYNPNFAQDTYAGKLIATELEVYKYMADLIGWDYLKGYGTFTFGGKGTNLYATKIAINKADKNNKKYGLERGKYFILSSQIGHPCHYEVCNWLGLGINSCIEIECAQNGRINLEKAYEVIKTNIEQGKIFLGFNLTGGSTNELFVDPIQDIYKLNLKIVEKYKLNYKPHIHVDSVLGWVYLFFNNYDYKLNKFNIDSKSLIKIKNLNKKVKELKYADSIGIDYHKTGFCPYTSSLFIVKNKNDFFTLNEEENISLEDLEYGNHNPYHNTLELTRSSTGPIAALCSLKSLGVEGFQQIISQMFSATEYFREQLNMNKKVSIINMDTEGFATLFIIKPDKYRNLEMQDFYHLDSKDITAIREYNINYGKYILKKSIKGEISFTYTSSRSYKLPGTDIKIGAIKAYPMSVFLTKTEIDRLIQEIDKSILEYNEISNHDFSKDISISDDMVYK